jgi:metal-responsive CopG/Arc/MetJ family transcriptional regulator
MIRLMAVRKWSVSIDEELAARVEEHVSDRGLSGFVAKAVEHELERDALAVYLEDLDAEFGAVPVDLVEQYDELWPS